jgi:hypothetical protein
MARSLAQFRLLDAVKLASPLGCSPEVLLYVALKGQWRYTLMTEKLSATMQIAERVYSLAQEQNDPAVMIGAYAAFLGGRDTRFSVITLKSQVKTADALIWRCYREGSKNSGFLCPPYRGERTCR